MFAFDIINTTRQKLLPLIRETALEDLNRIPKGFNNNIIWNFGHLVVSGYSLVFRSTGCDPDFQIPHFEQFRKGSKPTGPVTEETLTSLIELSAVFTPSVQKALSENHFETITEFTTQTFGVPVTTIEEAIASVMLHDTLHAQIIRDYKRILDPEK